MQYHTKSHATRLVSYKQRKYDLLVKLIDKTKDNATKLYTNESKLNRLKRSMGTNHQWVHIMSTLWLVWCNNKTMMRFELIFTRDYSNIHMRQCDIIWSPNKSITMKFIDFGAKFTFSDKFKLFASAKNCLLSFPQNNDFWWNKEMGFFSVQRLFVFWHDPIDISTNLELIIEIIRNVYSRFVLNL